jgi:hypothetical protein
MRTVCSARESFEHLVGFDIYVQLPGCGNRVQQVIEASPGMQFVEELSEKPRSWFVAGGQ